MLLATALALYLRMCSTDVYCSKQTGRLVAPKPSHPSFLRFWNWAEENVDAAKICGGAENVVKTETQQTFVNGSLRFYYFRHLYSAGSACVLLTIIAWVAHRYEAALSALLINILLGSFQLFLHSDPASLLRWNNPFKRCPPVGKCIIHAGGEVTSCTDWQTAFDVQPTTTSARSSRRASFSALASANSFVYFASSAATSRWRICMSVIAAFASFQFSGIFVAGLCW